MLQRADQRCRFDTSSSHRVLSRLTLATVSSPVGLSIRGTTAACPVWRCTGPETCSGNTGWGAPRRWRPAAPWSQPALLCWRSLSACWNRLSCQCGNRTDTKLQMNSRITLLILDRLLRRVCGQLRRSYVAPAATAEVFLNGIPAPSPAGCGLAWDCREEPAEYQDSFLQQTKF